MNFAAPSRRFYLAYIIIL